MSAAETVKPKVLLFDLGGVIVRWVGIEALMARLDLSREDVLVRFESSDIFNAYEQGRCDEDQFIPELKRLFELDMSNAETAKLWQSWVEPTYKGTKVALTKLRESYVIACLSNTNALHWSHLQTHINTDEYFDYAFASQLIKAAKPAPESYLIPVEKMDVKPSDIWFFDDTLANIEAAQHVGMTAFHVDREVGVLPTLVELGLLK